MKEKPIPYPHKHLTKEEVKAVKAFHAKHGIRWGQQRDNLLIMGHRGRLDINAYKRYCRLLRRINYEMLCVKSDIPIRIQDSDRILVIPYNSKFIQAGIN